MNADICICDGRYEGCDHGKICPNLADGQHSPHFCYKCDNNRINRIDEVFDEVTRRGYAARHVAK